MRVYSIWIYVVFSFISSGYIQMTIGSSTIEDTQLSSAFGQSILCQFYPCCTLNSTSSCPITSMSQGIRSYVFTGGNTRCIVSSSTPYAFQVTRGDPSKLLINFQGGGNCVFSLLGCVKDIIPPTATGIFDRSNINNPYKNYTVVFITYCSGDTHIGNSTGLYKDLNGEYVQYRGLVNTLAVLNWIESQSNAGLLAKKFSDLVIMGCSAGSVGAQYWAKKILDSLQWVNAAVIADSYVGVGLEKNFNLLANLFDLCRSGSFLLSSANKQRCLDQTITFLNFASQNFIYYPSVPFAFLQSKTDSTQSSFGISTTLSPSVFYNKSIEYLNNYQNYSNFLIYFVDSSQHCYTPYSLFYTANAVSETGGTLNLPGAFMSEMSMSQWVSLFPLTGKTSVSSQCVGLLEQSSLQAPKGQNTTFCPSTLLPHSFSKSLAQSSPSNSPVSSTTLISSQNNDNPSLTFSIVIPIVIVIGVVLLTIILANILLFCSKPCIKNSTYNNYNLDTVEILHGIEVKDVESN